MDLIFENRSVPPGGRYDPIGPPDVPGFEPSRFVR
jgi:proteasome inhibitor subunit 1 (PI31)